jgi:hypothetical protein
MSTTFESYKRLGEASFILLRYFLHKKGITADNGMFERFKKSSKQPISRQVRIPAEELFAVAEAALASEPLGERILPFSLERCWELCHIWVRWFLKTTLLTRSELKKIAHKDHIDLNPLIESQKYNSW